MIAVDLPGFGASPILSEPATPWALGAAVARLCAELGVERPHLAGNSLGGWVALEMAKAGHAASTCLISPAGLWRRPLGPRRVDAAGGRDGCGRWCWARPGSKPLREAMLRTSIGLPERAPAGDGTGDDRGLDRLPRLRGCERGDAALVCEDLDLVTVPTTIVWGELDRLVAPPRPERRPPGSRFLRIERIGHTPNWDDPELVAKLLLEASSPVAAGP